MNHNGIRKTWVLLMCCAAALLCGCTAKTADALDEIALLQAADGVLEETPGSPGAQVQEAHTVSGIVDLTSAGNTTAEHPAGSDDGETTDVGNPCYVHICGAVREPGVYRMAEGDRIFAVIEKAGGFMEDACADYVNQAQAVADGLKIWIPTMQEAQAGSNAEPWRGGRYGAGENAGLEYPRETGVWETPSLSESGLININTATEEQLCSLPGIGRAKAQAVIAYRSEHGDFFRTEDIMKVSGIGQGNYEKIKTRITAAR